MNIYFEGTNIFTQHIDIIYIIIIFISSMLKIFFSIVTLADSHKGNQNYGYIKKLNLWLYDP